MIRELFKTIESIEGLAEGSTGVTITFTDGSTIRQYHDQDCCESVSVAQADGNVLRHLGAEAYSIEEKVDGRYDGGADAEYIPESATAFFYTLKTSKGYLDWRWVGESNGYYSEHVEMKFEGGFKEL